MKQLVYIRRSKEFNQMVLKYATANNSYTSTQTISEYKNADFRIDVNEKTPDYDPQIQQYIEKHLNKESIIFRDRLLRNLPYEKSMRLIHRATSSILQIIKNEDYQRIVMYPIDNYIMDILAQVAKTENIICDGVSNFFIKGYKRITTYGEPRKIRVVEEAEINTCVNLLRTNFRSHMAPGRKEAIRKAIYRYFKYKLRYLYFYIYKHKICRKNEYDYISTPLSSTTRKLKNFFCERHFTKSKNLTFKSNSIYIPLHYFPEATIEYWSDNLHQVDFNYLINCKVRELSKKYEQIILKEHPAAMFNNPPEFYLELLKTKNVVILSAFDNTSEILQKIKTVGVWTGTTGIEALINGINVAFFNKHSYYYKIIKNNNIGVHSEDTLSINDPTILMREILSGCIRE